MGSRNVTAPNKSCACRGGSNLYSFTDAMRAPAKFLLELVLKIQKATLGKPPCTKPKQTH
jgi:hypothetical protein